MLTYGTGHNKLFFLRPVPAWLPLIVVPDRPVDPVPSSLVPDDPGYLAEQRFLWLKCNVSTFQRKRAPKGDCPCYGKLQRTRKLEEGADT